MIFFELFTTAFMCIFYGVVITTAIMALLYFILKEIDKNTVRTVPFYCTGVVLFLLLVIQFSLMMGAFEAKSYVDGIEITISRMVEGVSGIVSAEESQKILEEATGGNQLFGLFFNTCNFSGNDYEDLPAVMAETFRSGLNSYIWRRIWWTLGIIVLGILIISLPNTKGSNRNSKKGNSSRGSSDYRSRRSSYGSNHFSI